MIIYEGTAVAPSFFTAGADPTLGIFLENARSTCGFGLVSTIPPVPIGIIVKLN